MWVTLPDGRAYNFAHFWELESGDDGFTARIPGREGIVHVPIPDQQARDQVLENLTKGNGTVVH